MTSILDTRSAGDRRRTRRFLIEFGIGIGAYLIAVAAAVGLAQGPGSGGVGWLLALLPLLPVVWIAVATGRHFRRLDERERAVMLEGLGVGFVVAMLAAVTLGLLGAFLGAVPGEAWWVYAAGMLAWLVASLIRRGR